MGRLPRVRIDYIVGCILPKRERNGRVFHERFNAPQPALL